jgi:hypothetical protein
VTRTLRLAVALLLAPAVGLAQDAPPQAAASDAAAAEPVTLTAFFFTQGETTAPTSVGITAALRRSLLDDARVDYRDPSDLMSTAERREAADAAVALLAEARGLVEQAQYAEAMPHLEEVIGRFDENLGLIKRKDLTDALMLLAVTRCAARRQEECVATFEKVLTFREAMPWDAERYPDLAAAAFEEARQRVRRRARGSVEFRTEPEGAEIFVDGRSRGASALVVEGLLVGDHYVTIKLAGYEKVAARFTVAPDYQETYEYTLERSDQYLILQQALRDLQPEIGRERAGTGILALRGILFVNQVVLGRIDERPDGQLAVHVCLYDLRTGLRLKDLRREGRLGTAGPLARLGPDLYQGVDLRGFVEAPPAPPPPPPPPSRSVFTQWWFWTAVGVAIAGVTTAVVLAPESEGPPEGTTRVTIGIDTRSER